MAASSKRIDEVSSTLTYFGEAPTGASPSQDVWRIQKIETVGTETSVKYAGGNTNWNSRWDDRLTLTYS